MFRCRNVRKQKRPTDRHRDFRSQLGARREGLKEEIKEAEPRGKRSGGFPGRREGGLELCFTNLKCSGGAHRRGGSLQGEGQVPPDSVHGLNRGEDREVLGRWERRKNGISRHGNGRVVISQSFGGKGKPKEPGWGRNEHGVAGGGKLQLKHVSHTP